MTLTRRTVERLNNKRLNGVSPVNVLGNVFFYCIYKCVICLRYMYIVKKKERDWKKDGLTQHGLCDFLNLLEFRDGLMVE